MSQVAKIWPEDSNFKECFQFQQFALHAISVKIELITTVICQSKFKPEVSF